MNSSCMEAMGCNKTRKIYCFKFDDYAVHETEKVRNELAKLGTFVIMLPGGTTNHIQVLDVGINKPFKTALRNASRKWLMHNPLTDTKRGRPDIARSIVDIWGIYCN
jgi:hypothetical protein